MIDNFPFHQMEMKFQHMDGRIFKVERGTVTLSVGREPDHNAFVIRAHYEWGMTTTRSLRVTRENLYDFVDELIGVFNVNWLDSVKEMEAYLLFSEEYVAHEGPLGIVNIHDQQKVLIFDDLYSKYGK